MKDIGIVTDEPAFLGAFTYIRFVRSPPSEEKVKVVDDASDSSALAEAPVKDRRW